MKHFSWILRIFHIFILYAWIAFILLLPASPIFSLQLFVLLNILFALVFTGLLITQIVGAFKIFKREDSEQCIKAFLFFKYSSLPAVLILLAIFLVVLLGGIGLSFVLLVLPATLFIAPFFFAMSLVVAPLFLGMSFMAGLAGFSYAICLIILSRKQNVSCILFSSAFPASIYWMVCILPCDIGIGGKSYQSSLQFLLSSD